MRPSVGGKNPLMMENRVVLPAPLGPISAAMGPVSMATEASSTANRPPKRLDTRSRRSSGSAMGALRERQARKTPAQVRERTSNPPRGERHDQDEHAAIDDEVEARRIAGEELGQFAQCLDHQGAEQRTEHCSDAADDGCEQGFDGNPRSV